MAWRVSKVLAAWRIMADVSTKTVFSLVYEMGMKWNDLVCHMKSYERDHSHTMR